jgi:hypothetical protein
MRVLSLSDLAEGRGPLVDVCLAIPALFLAKKDLAGAATLLASIASMTAEYVPVSAENPEPDVFASLWFIRAGHLFNKAVLADPAAEGREGERTLFAETLLPLNKKILQQIISASSTAGVRMDDGGLLIPQADKATQTLRLNALWYSALESTGTDLKAVGDRVADHFERLAGRFRRSFAKAYWSDAHGCIWTPELRNNNGGGEEASLPDADQLLLTFLCASPIPRTKQRQLLQQVQAKSLPAGSRGVRMRHPVHGVVESPLHLMWMAQGVMASADPPGAGIDEARRLLASVGGARGQTGVEGGGVPAFVVPGEAFSGHADAVTTAEFLGALATLA